MDEKITDIESRRKKFDWLQLSQEDYDGCGRLDVNIKLHVKVGTNLADSPDEHFVMAYGKDRNCIVQAETASDLEAMLEEFIRVKMAESNLHLEKMVIV